MPRTKQLPPPEPEEEEGGPVKPFLEHLEDLRWLLIRCIATLVVGMGVCMAAAPILVEVLQWPFINAMKGKPVPLNTFGPMATVVLYMRLSLYGGLVLSIPVILFFLGQYIMPALKQTEKTYFRRAFIIGGGLFLLGVILCYSFVLSLSLKGMVNLSAWMGFPPEIWRAEEYFQFVIVLMLGMGISFEVPLLILTLVKLELLQLDWLIKGRKYFLFVNFVVCAFITPDFLSTFFLVIPTQILLEICILIARRWERQKQEAEAALASESGEMAAD